MRLIDMVGTSERRDGRLIDIEQRFLTFYQASRSMANDFVDGVGGGVRRAASLAGR